MKKVIFLAFLAVGFAGSLHSGTIVVTQPAGGNVTMGAAMPIVWTASGVVGEVKIQLIRPGGALVGLLVTNYDVGCLSWNWTVAAPAVAGESYKIRVRALDGSAADESAEFAVVGDGGPGPISIAINTPNGGETWEYGSIQVISWNGSNLPVNCHLYLLKNDQVLGLISDTVNGPNGGSKNWNVGNYLGGSPSSGSGYKVRIETFDGQTSDTSDNPFTIAPLPLVMHYNPIPKPDYRVLAKLLPDLVVCAEWTSKRPQLGDKRTVTVKVKNIGTGAAPAANFDFYVEGHGTANIPLPALAKNAEYLYAHQFWWNSWGHKTVRITIDPKKQVTEANENNNQVSGSIEVILMRDAYGVTTSRCSDQN